VNICLAHISLFDEAISNSSSLLLILEDDAYLSGEVLDKEELLTFVEEILTKTSIPSFINLSRSLTLKQLKMEELVENNKHIMLASNIFLPQKMFHNTTCANLYNLNYITNFRNDWYKSIEMLVFAGTPFDWIINALILELPQNELLTFHQLNPMIVQGSMY